MLVKFYIFVTRVDDQKNIHMVCGLGWEAER